MTHYIHRNDLDEMVIEIIHLSTNSSNDMLNEIEFAQPILMQYLEYLADHSPVSDDPSVFSRSEYRYIYLISIVTLRLLIDSRHWPDEVSWDDINATIAASQPVANDIFANPTGLSDIVQGLAEDHPEPELLLFLSDACHKRLDDKPDEPPIRVKYRPTAFLIFYTILMSLLNNSSIKEPEVN
ncbi:MAG: hypothetical protein H6631_06220 [Anaerolineaceae bacterium]|nr:hypothetical protein [Anaerolineaceae bacterium]MCB9100333.1 hypothetical protein [Anaerolineales bacterium]